MRYAPLFVLVCFACSHPRALPPPPSPPSTPTAPATLRSERARVSDTAAAAPTSTQRPPVTVEDLLAAASDLQALALFREHDFDPDGESLVISGMPDTGPSASCIKSPALTRCIDHAGFGHAHLLRALRDETRPSIAAPAWAESMLAVAASAEVDSIDVLDHEGGRMLMVNDLEGARFALRRDGRWRLSGPKSGGKSLAPFYFGSLDTTRATTVPSIGLMLGHYMKEGCVRSETVELVVLEVKDDALEDLGSVVIGRGNWLALDHTFAPFDPKDPNHYRIQLRPRVQHDGQVRFEIESRHTPKALRKRKHACGVELSMRDIDDVTKLVGTHELTDVFETSPAE